MVSIDFFYHVVTLKCPFWENALQSSALNLAYLEEAISTEHHKFIFYLVLSCRISHHYSKISKVLQVSFSLNNFCMNMISENFTIKKIPFAISNLK
jgi:hypothetical protein